ncbi:Imm49 family immunity protein [Haloferula chungangensis]|uniref:Imm49 family immunity protein n=1 Tax=Haloferula chungangensis TaxID=1048331 RepID=A0ABW2L3W1_9BACT
MKILPAHYSLPGPSVAERYDRMAADLGKWKSKLETSPQALSSFPSYACQMAALAHALGKPAEEIRHWCRFALDSGIASLQSAFTPQGQAIEVSLSGDPVSLAALGEQSQFAPTDWRACFYLSLILHDRESRYFLIKNEAGMIGKKSPTVPHPWFGQISSLLVHLTLDRKREWENGYDGLVETLKNQPSLPPFVTAVEIPVLKLGEEIIHTSTENWDSLIEQALTAHSHFFAADPTRAEDPYGFIAWGPLAMQDFAATKGFGNGVESPYLPASLL